MGQEENVPLGFLARTQIADRDGAVRLSTQVDDALNRLDRYFRAVGMQQDCFNKLVLALEQFETRVRIGKILFKLRACDFVGRSGVNESPRSPTGKAVAPINTPSTIDTVTRIGSHSVRPMVSNAAMPV